MDIKRHALNWRWKKLNEPPESIEEPLGVCELIDSFVFGKQSWEQKSLSCSLKKKEKILMEVCEWKKKEESN